MRTKAKSLRKKINAHKSDSKGVLVQIFMGTVLISILGISFSVKAQVRHRYPRTAIFQWGGAPAEWYAKFDLVDFSNNDAGFARGIKSINPNVYILPTRDFNAGAGISPFPEQWYLKDSKGNRVPLYGPDTFIADMSEYCTPYNGKKYNEYLPEYMVNIIDLSVFDGVATDGLWDHPYGTSDVDLDKNGVNDWNEHGRSWLEEKWLQGVNKMLARLRELVRNKLILVNSGRFHTFGWDKSNGVLLEHTGCFFTWESFKNMYDSWMNQAPEPHILLMDVNPFGDDPLLPNPSKNYYRLMRFMLTATMLGDGYFSFTDIGAGEHSYTKYYDEYDVDLGYPTTQAQVLHNGVWVRFFDRGVSLTNPTGSNQRVTDGDLRTLTGYNGPYYRFQGGQDPSHNTGEQFTEITLASVLQPYGGSLQRIIGDGILLVKAPTVVISDIIIDDVDAGTSPGSGPAELVGNWIHDSETGGEFYQMTFAPWRDLWKYAYSNASGGESQATYRPTIGVAGYYEIFEWHGWLGNDPEQVREATNVPYTITYGGGKTANGTINQSTNYGKWNSLGTYYFDKGTNGYIKITNNANGVVVADAFKFVFKGSGPQDTVPPNEPRELKSENKTENSLTLSWLPPLAASDGDIASSYQVYRNNSLIGTPSSTSYLDSGLSESTTYDYSVYAVDDAGNRSISATTGRFTTLADLTPPKIASVKALGSTSVEIVFSEAVERTSAENINNYTIDKKITILAAVLLDNLNTVHLTTSEHVAGITYTIIVNNIKDRASSPNTVVPNSSATYVGVGNPLSITISVDNEYELYINGVLIGTGKDWEDAESYSVASVAGKNVIAVKCIDKGQEAGLIAEIEFNGKHYVSDETWKVSTTEQSGWETVAFDDGTWQKATSYGLHGVALPWARYRNVQGISTTSNVHWIWSSDNQNNDLVYLRFTINPGGDSIPPATPTGVNVRNL